MKFSVVIPVYNSANSIEKVIDEVRHFFRVSGTTYEIILVDDGSDSKTRLVLDDLIQKSGSSNLNDLILIRQTNNIGQQSALLKGLLCAKGEHAVTIDDDLQHDINDLKALYACALSGADLVFGIYSAYGEKNSRALGSKLIGLFFKLKYKKLAGARVSSYRLIHRTVYSKLIDSGNRFVYLSAELIPYARRVDNAIIKRRERLYGKSGYTLMGCVKIGLRLVYHYGLKPASAIKRGRVRHEEVADGRRG